MALYKGFPGISRYKGRGLFSINYVGLLTLLSKCGDECGKHWRTIQLIKVEDSKIPVSPLMLFSFVKR